MAEFEKQWCTAVDQIRYALNGKRRVIINDRGPEVLLAQVDHSFLPFNGWVLSKMEPQAEKLGERLISFNVSEQPGELLAYTFFPRPSIRIGSSGVLNGHGAEQSAEADVQDLFNDSEPTPETYNEFFTTAELLFQRSF